MAQNKAPSLIAITGGSGTGKTTLARAIEGLAGPVALLSQDDYYADAVIDVPVCDYDFDRPSLIEWQRLNSDIAALRRGDCVHTPVYTHATGSRSATRLVTSAPVIIVEGIFILTDPLIRELSDINVFLHLDAETRLKRRLARDVAERGQTEAEILDRWHRFLVPAHEAHIEPQRAHCHLVLEEHSPHEMARRVLEMLTPQDIRKEAAE